MLPMRDKQRPITEDQALAGSRFSIPGFSGTGFGQIPGSRDFPGRDLPLFLIPGLFKKFPGFFGILVFASCVGQITSFSSIFMFIIVTIVRMNLFA